MWVRVPMPSSQPPGTSSWRTAQTARVSVVNLATGSPVSGSPVTVGSNPDAVGVAGDVFVANKGSNSISILNPTNGSVLQTVGSVQSPVSLSVGIAPGSSATSALSIAESLGLSNPAEALVWVSPK